MANNPKENSNRENNNNNHLTINDKSNRPTGHSPGGPSNHSFGNGNVKDMYGSSASNNMSSSSLRSNMNSKRTGGSIDNKDGKGLSIYKSSQVKTNNLTGGMDHANTENNNNKYIGNIKRDDVNCNTN